MRLYVFPLHGKRDKGKETTPENALSALSDAKAHFLRGIKKISQALRKTNRNGKQQRCSAAPLLMATSEKRWDRKTTRAPFPAESTQTGKSGKGKETPARTRRLEVGSAKRHSTARPEVSGQTFSCSQGHRGTVGKEKVTTAPGRPILQNKARLGGDGGV